jgi:MFS-type transporter involved in bile tolerance (Atg22 family)
VSTNLIVTDWVVLGVWWFIFQQKRPGPKMPKGSNYATIGIKQVWLAFREIRSLPWTFIYLLAFFLLADGLNTSGLFPLHFTSSNRQVCLRNLIGTLVSIIQNEQIEFSFLQLTYLGITQAVTSIASTFGFWYFQKYFKIKTKPMFLVTNFFSVFIPLWGMLGLWTTKIGYHNTVRYLYPNFDGQISQPPSPPNRKKNLLTKPN